MVADACQPPARGCAVLPPRELEVPRRHLQLPRLHLRQASLRTHCLRIQEHDHNVQFAFDYGGFAFAKETLNLIDNLERSKQILENDEKLKNTDALKKTLEHFDIIYKDMVSILSKNGITPLDSIGKKLDPNPTFKKNLFQIGPLEKRPGSESDFIRFKLNFSSFLSI